MYKENKVIAIIAAAGRGTRLGSQLPKQFLKIGGETILQKSVRAFQGNSQVDEIIVVTDAEFTEFTQALCHSFSKVSRVVSGGEERQDSVRAGLDCADSLLNDEDEDAIVLIHDAARPFVSRRVIDAVTEAAARTGAAIPAVALKDTVRQTTLPEECSDIRQAFAENLDLMESLTLRRGSLCSVQTPQGFSAGILRRAYKKAYEDGFLGTDDASIVERLGISITIIEGDYANYKITTKEDLKTEMRIGSGYDVHRLVEERPLFLCGVEIPHDRGLLGHSDADVALHALMDALLGAAALGDIGKHFPDTDERYKGISSMRLLEEVRGMLEKEGYFLGNADITIIAQKPKIASYIPQMRKVIAETLKTEANKINIKGTTTEKLGFVGREEGIAAEAVCVLYRN